VSRPASPRRLAVGLAVAAAIAAVVGGCGGSGGDRALPGNRIPGRTLRIWVSGPESGPSDVSGDAVFLGADLALRALGDRIGRYRIELRQLSDSLSTTSEWNAGQTATGAESAVNSASTIGYIGDLDSGASAVSIPILNAAGIAQVSPGATAVGLTSPGIGADYGEPQKYYPSGHRTFVRVVPSDLVEARVQLAIQEQAGCVSTYVLDDGEFDGVDAGETFVDEAQTSGLHIAGQQSYNPAATTYASLGQTIAQSGANCVLIAAITDANAAELTAQIAAALPGLPLFATWGVAESSFTDPRDGGIPLSIDSRLQITAPGANPATSAVAEFDRRYHADFPSYPLEPLAIDGYEAMSLMLSAIRRATDGGTRPAERSKVVAALFDTRDHDSPLGRYSVEPDGSTTLDTYDVYKVRGGQLRFWRAVRG
jgi:branched-chain amino acid transport system substrate-binding protein